MPEPRFTALQRRLIRFGVAACKAVRKLPRDYATVHCVQQLVRSSTSVASNYAEARAAESRRDFIHKMQLCLKELRESSVWIEFLIELLGPSKDRDDVLKECDELTAIFVASLKTAQKQRSPDT